MKITSPAFADSSPIPRVHTCDDEDTNPALFFEEAPAGTASFALLVRDPDAPSGDFVHWIVWNIEPDVTEILEDSVPVMATEGANDAGETGWMGPCPPSGTHRYEFHLYALDTMLDLPAGSAKEAFREAIRSHVLEEAVLVGIYSRMP